MEPLPILGLLVLFPPARPPFRPDWWTWKDKNFDALLMGCEASAGAASVAVAVATDSIG